MKSAPRMYGIVATQAPVVALLVRVAARWSRVLRWDVRTDTIEEGASFAGTMYARRADISPDGVYLCSYLMRGGKPHFSISKLPWVFGLRWWPTSGGKDWGFCFAEKRVPPRLQESTQARNGPELTLPAGWRLEPRGAGAFDNEIRRGWTTAADSPAAPRQELWKEKQNLILERRQPRGKAVLRMNRGPWTTTPPTIDGCRPNYSFTRPFRGDEVLETVSWADWLSDGRMVFSTWHGTVGIAGVTEQRISLISEHDLTHLTKTRTRAPDWARRW